MTEPSMTRQDGPDHRWHERDRQGDGDRPGRHGCPGGHHGPRPGPGRPGCRCHRPRIGQPRGGCLRGRPVVAGRGAAAGRRGPRRVSAAGCAPQQRRRLLGHPARHRRRARAHLRPEPPRAVPAHQPAPRAAEAERSGAGGHRGFRRAHRRAASTSTTSRASGPGRARAPTTSPSSRTCCSRTSWRGGWQASTVTANALHPGVVRTSFGAADPGGVQKLLVPFMRPFMKSPGAGRRHVDPSGILARPRAGDGAVLREQQAQAILEGQLRHGRRSTALAGERRSRALTGRQGHGQGSMPTTGACSPSPSTLQEPSHDTRDTAAGRQYRAKETSMSIPSGGIGLPTATAARRPRGPAVRPGRVFGLRAPRRRQPCRRGHRDHRHRMLVTMAQELTLPAVTGTAVVGRTELALTDASPARPLRHRRPRSRAGGLDLVPRSRWIDPVPPRRTCRRPGRTSPTARGSCPRT